MHVTVVGMDSTHGRSPVYEIRRASRDGPCQTRFPRSAPRAKGRGAPSALQIWGPQRIFPTW